MTGWRDPAEYGYADLPRVGGIAVIPNVGPEATTCRTCGQVATDHGPGEFSIYGQCPDRGPILPDLWEGDQA